MIGSIMFAIALLSQASPQGDGPKCALSDADIQNNRTLSFSAFDQEGTTPSSARQLGERGCDAEAAQATEDYLLYGPPLTEREKNVLSWHLSQYLAGAGREAEAAVVAATTRRAPEEEPDGFDWNTYVFGTWAFLKNDRDRLDEAAAKLASAPGQRNAMNARILKRFQKCFDRPYSEAYFAAACAPD